MLTVRDDQPAVGTWGVVAAVAAIAGLLLLDLLLGRTYFGVSLASLGAGALVGAAVPVARRSLPLAAVLAVAASLGWSWLVHRSNGSLPDALVVPPSPGPAGLELRFGRDDWPGMAEAGGLLLVLCWSLRSLVAPAAAAVAVGVGGAFAAMLEVREEFRYDRLLLVGYGLAFAIAAGAGLYLRWLDAERDRDLDLVRQHERLAIARELHDVVAHHVTGIVVQAQAAQAVWAERPGAALEALARIEGAGAEAMASMRRLVGTLRADEPAALAPTATVEDLRTLADRSTAMGLPVRVHLEGLEELPAAVAPSVHRVVGEAITNAQRHATGATGVDVRLRASGDELTLEVVDDGRSARPPRPGGPGYGLTGMAERTEALGGRFEAGPSTGGGWRIRAWLPLGRTA